MDIRQCEVLVDLSETKNISKTAERLGYSQPGVSHILKTMEDECGFQLAVREKYGLSMTPMAEKILPAVRSLLERSENLKETIASINGIEEGSISIGAYPSIAINLLPEIIIEFHEKHPGIRFSIKEGGSGSILSYLKDSSVDLALMSVPESFTGEFIPLIDDPLKAVFPKDSEYVKSHKKLVISEIRDMDYIMVADGNDYDVAALLDKYDISISTDFSFLDDRSIITMVNAGLGVSILSDLIIRGYEDEIDSLPLYPPASRKLGIAYPDKNFLSPAARVFIEFAEEKLSSQNDS